jgi:hypothetical protein
VAGARIVMQSDSVVVMPSTVVPEHAEKIESGQRCARCAKSLQFPRLIVDPTTSRRFNFFECLACGYPNWTELKQR